jgi:hypothetical protein
VPFLVVASGVIMYWTFSGNLSVAYFTSFRGIALTIGALSEVIAFIEGMLVIGPSARRMAEIGVEIEASGDPPSPEQMAEIGVQRKRLARAGRNGTIFLTVALVGMG